MHFKLAWCGISCCHVAMCVIACASRTHSYLVAIGIVKLDSFRFESCVGSYNLAGFAVPLVSGCVCVCLACALHALVALSQLPDLV